MNLHINNDFPQRCQSKLTKKYNNVFSANGDGTAVYVGEKN